jgi:hypothetical protein
MEYIVTGRLLQRSANLVWNMAARVAVVALLLASPCVTFAQAETDFEKPPVLNVRDLVAENLLQGKGFRVAEKVPTDGVMGIYTLIADKETFGEDAGTYQVLSREMAELRLAEYHEKQKPITAVAAPGPVVARDQEGALILPAPVDYVSWTERVAFFAKNPKLQVAPKRTLWITGLMSPRAKKEFEANGWTIHVGKEP